MSSFCVMCGTGLAQGTRFCNACGAAVAEPGSVGAPPPPVAPERGVAATKPLAGWIGGLIGLGLCAFSFAIVSHGIEGKAVLFLLAVSTSLWAAIDSVRMRLREYATILASHPVVLFIGMVVFMPLSWPVMFAWYLVVRSKIRAGRLRRRDYPKRHGFAVLLIPLGALLVLALVSAALFISAGPSIKGVWDITSSQ